MNSYTNIFNNSIKNTLFAKLPHAKQEFIKEKARKFHFSYQGLKSKETLAWQKH
ncbi:MAG: hypothetical protein NTZ60_11640 [Campylobacterales bacterium]|nr:hypothetical protein [Campylobacterales bacterium]